VQHCRHWGEQDPHRDHAETFFRARFAVCADLVGMSADVSRPACTDPQISKALAYSDAHLAQSIEASEVAHASGLSERTLQRRFSEQFGETCSQTLNRMRMIRAIELLCDPDRKVLTIAGDCGFQSLSAFNRSFRAYTGVTPSAFRKNLDA
jgi:AraC-like DNA-binding protein